MANQISSLSKLPIEINGMIIEQVVMDIRHDHHRDVSGWSNGWSEAPLASKEPTYEVLPPVFYHTNQVLNTGQRHNGKVKVTLHPRTGKVFLPRAGVLTVLIPRQWCQVLASGVFQDTDFSMFSRDMDVEIVNMIRTSQGQPSGPDTRIEAAVRELLQQKRVIKVSDLKLHAFRANTTNLTCFLPQVQQLTIDHEAVDFWFDDQFWPLSYLARTALHPLDDIHAISWPEYNALKSTGVLPCDLESALLRRDITLDVLARWIPNEGLSRSRLRRQLRSSGWTGRTRFTVKIACLAERPLWAGFDAIHIVLTFNHDLQEGWTIMKCAHEFEQGPISWETARFLRRLSF